MSPRYPIKDLKLLHRVQIHELADQLDQALRAGDVRAIGLIERLNVKQDRPDLARTAQRLKLLGQD